MSAGSCRWDWRSPPVVLDHGLQALPPLAHELDRFMNELGVSICFPRRASARSRRPWRTRSARGQGEHHVRPRGRDAADAGRDQQGIDEAELGLLGQARATRLGRHQVVFMIGLLTETDEDVDGIAETLGSRRNGPAAGTSGCTSTSGSRPTSKRTRPLVGDPGRHGDPLAEDRPAEDGIPRDGERAPEWRDPKTAFEVFARGDVGPRTRSMPPGGSAPASTAGRSASTSISGCAPSEPASTRRCTLRPRDLEETLPWDHIRTPVVKKSWSPSAKAYAAALMPRLPRPRLLSLRRLCFTPKAREGRRGVVQLCPGRGRTRIRSRSPSRPGHTTADIERREEP